MTGFPIWLVLVVAVGVPVASLVVNFRMNRRTLAATQSKTDAEVLDLNVKTQNEMMKRIREDNAELTTRVDTLEQLYKEALSATRSAQQEARNAREDADLARSETRKAQAAAATSESQIRALVKHIKATHTWITEYAANHPPQAPPPPKLPLDLPSLDSIDADADAPGG